MDQGCHFRSLSDLCCSVAKSCPALCDPMDCSTSGFLVLHYLYFKLCLIQPFSGIDVPREWVQGWGLPAGWGAFFHPSGSFCHHPWSLQAAPWPVTFIEGGCQAAAVSPNPVPPVQAPALLFMDSLTKLSFNRLLSHGSPLSYPGLRNPGTKEAGRLQSIVSQESQTRLSD